MANTTLIKQSRLPSLVISQVDSMCPWYDVMKREPHLVFFPQTHNLSLIMKKYQINQT